MKKVGILSMQRVLNYGSFLQAYALKQLLLWAGADKVDFLDIIPGTNLISKDRRISRLRQIFKHIINLIKHDQLIEGLKNYFFNKKLGYSIKKNWCFLGLDNFHEKTFDIVVIGSDEVFNCCQDVAWGYSTQLFGDIPKDMAKDIVSYAGSFGYTELNDLIKLGINKEIGIYLNNLSDISVRDLNSKQIVETLTNKKATIHLDPVLIYGYKEELESMTEISYNRPYMIIYSYQGRIIDKDEISVIKKYSREKGLRLISIFCRYNWCDEYVIPTSVFDVLRWFKFAEAIITDTFHGTIFSIITHSRFVTFIRPSNKNKLHYLLEILNLDHREIKEISLFMERISSEINYDKTDELLEIFRKETKEYLFNIISKEKN